MSQSEDDAQADLTQFQAEESRQKPNWTPIEDESEDSSKCQHCGCPVTLQFRRVFGDNDDTVYGCTGCCTYRELSGRVDKPREQ